MNGLLLTLLRLLPLLPLLLLLLLMGSTCSGLVLPSLPERAGRGDQTARKAQQLLS
jgi:hypothetical protein